MRVESGKRARNGGWIHPLGDAPKPARMAVESVRRESDAELAKTFAPLALRYVNDADAQRMAELARELGVSAASLAALQTGWDGAAWTTPERNHRGMAVGINRRFPCGKKMCVAGSRRGLTYAENWRGAPGPLFIVEGASDVAAGITMGLCVVGRPSNVGGVEYLAKMLGAYPGRIVIVAERDQKDCAALKRHGENCRCCAQCFPGKYGAIESSKRLSLILRRIVEWSFLPDGAKDLRGWLIGKGDPNDATAMRRLGESLRRRMKNGIK